MKSNHAICSNQFHKDGRSSVSTSSIVNYVYYAIPRIAGVSLFAGINVLQGIYAKYYGLELTLIASVILFSRLFDAVTDPVIGYLSDRAWHKSGSRKTFIIIGALITIVSGYFLYSPPSEVSIA